MRIIVFIFCFLVIRFCNAQNEIPYTSFVKLKNGKVITGYSLKFDDRLLTSSTLTLDSVTVKSRDVLFYRGSSPFDPLYGRCHNQLVASHANGNGIYFYQVYTSHYNASGGVNGRGSYSTSTSIYYSKGIDAVKSPTLNNLVIDLTGDGKTTELLNLALNYRKKSRQFFGLGALVLAASPFVARVVPVGGGAIMIGGIACLGIGFIKIRKKNNTKEEALTLYTGVKL